MDEDQEPQSKLDVYDFRRRMLLEEAHNASRIFGDVLKWTLASLLLVNGAAVVALLNAQGLRVMMLDDAGWMFATGMTLALLGGGFWAKLYNDTSWRLLKAAWQDQDSSTPSLEEICRRPVAWKYQAGFASFLWLGSLFCFMLGSATVAGMASGLADAELEIAARKEVANTRATNERQ